MARTKTEVRNWLNDKAGQQVADKSNPDLNGQCVALIKGLMEFLGVPNPYAARGNAKDAGDNYIRQGIGTSGRGWLTVCINRSMGGGYGHIWVDLLNEFNIEQNGGRALYVTRGTRPITQAQQFVNFDKWITEDNKGDEPVVDNNAAHKGRVNRIFKQTRGRFMSDGEFGQFVGKNYLQVNEILGDDEEAFRNERHAEIGLIASRDNWAGQIADRTRERDEANKIAADAQKVAEQARLEAEAAKAAFAELEKKQADDKAAGDTFLVRLGQFIKKYIPGGKS